jgi:hypothetical protein
MHALEIRVIPLATTPDPFEPLRGRNADIVIDDVAYGFDVGWGSLRRQVGREGRYEHYTDRSYGVFHVLNTVVLLKRRYVGRAKIFDRRFRVNHSPHG